MSSRDVVATVPARLWDSWLAEGDLPGEDAQYRSHFWLPHMPHEVAIGDRLYIVAHGKLRGYAPITDRELSCELDPSRPCLVREGGAVAVTLRCAGCYGVSREDCGQCDGSGIEPIRGFRGYRYRWWQRLHEVTFTSWRTP